METLNMIGSICSIVSLLLAIFIAGKVIQINMKINNDQSNKVKQKGNSVQGDQAGRDITK